jgi:hypothetical protein
LGKRGSFLSVIRHNRTRAELELPQGGNRFA